MLFVNLIKDIVFNKFKIYLTILKMKVKITLISIFSLFNFLQASKIIFELGRNKKCFKDEFIEKQVTLFS